MSSRVRTRGSRSVKPARRSRVNSRRTCSPSTPCTHGRRRKRSSSCPTPSSHTSPNPVRICPPTGPGSTGRTSPPRMPTCIGCCSSCSGRSAGGARPPTGGCSNPPHTSATWTRCGLSSRICMWCTCIATHGTRSRPERASTRPCTPCMPTMSTCTESAPNGSNGWAGPMIGRCSPGSGGRTTARASPTSTSPTRSPIRWARWRAYTTPSVSR